MWTKAELQKFNPLLQLLEAADGKLMSAYDDTIHLNNGTHLDGGINHAKSKNAMPLPLYRCVSPHPVGPT